MISAFISFLLLVVSMASNESTPCPECLPGSIKWSYVDEKLIRMDPSSLHPSLPSLSSPSTILLQWFGKKKMFQGVSDDNAGDEGTPSGDFDALNALLSRIEFNFPDINIDQRGFQLSIADLRCGGIRIDDISLTSSRSDAMSIDSRLSLDGISLQCQGNFTYTTLVIFKGKGLVTKGRDHAGGGWGTGGCLTHILYYRLRDICSECR